MDKSLELRLIEEGYSPISQKIELKNAGESIQRIVNEIVQTYQSSDTAYSDLILFEGSPTVTIKTRHTSILQSPAVAIISGINMGGPRPIPLWSLRVYSLNDLMKYEINSGKLSGLVELKDRDHLYFDGRDTKLVVDVQRKGWSRSNDAEISINQRDGEGVLYFQRADPHEKNRYFFESIALRVGFTSLPKETMPGYTYEFAVEQDGIKFRMTDNTVTTTFPTKKQRIFLSEIVEGLDVKPLEIDGVKCEKHSKPYIPLGGKEFSIQIEKYPRGEEFIKYLSRVLQKSK